MGPAILALKCQARAGSCCAAARARAGGLAAKLKEPARSRRKRKEQEQEEEEGEVIRDVLPQCRDSGYYTVNLAAMHDGLIFVLYASSFSDCQGDAAAVTTPADNPGASGAHGAQTKTHQQTVKRKFWNMASVAG